MPHATDHRIVLVRHGQTEWSRSGQHTSTTDIDLTDEGRAQADRLAGVLAGRRFALVLSSPKRRATETARRAGFADFQIEPGLSEWNYGEYEGVTSTEIRRKVPGWTVWTHPSPGGESPGEVGVRTDAVLARCATAPGDVLLFAHGHLLRVLTARWLGLAPVDGRFFLLDPATVSELGYDRETRAIALWNASVH